MPISLLVTNDLGPRAGGIETFIHGLIDELCRDGRTQLVIYTGHQDGAEHFDAELKSRYGIDVIRDRMSILLPTPRVNRAVVKLMKSRGITTVWFGALAPLGWMSGLLRRNGATRIISLTHGHEVWWSKLWPFSWLIRAMTRNIDLITYLGSFTLNAMKPALSKSVHTERIAPGIDIGHFTPLGPQTDLVERYQLAHKRVILSVGRLVQRKGQDRLIEAMPKILAAEPDALLMIVGIGRYEQHLRELVKKLGIEQQVIFVGRISYQDLPRYLQLAEIFAMPSRSRFFGLEVEGLGIVYLEASACGIPVLAGASGGAPDAVLEGETGRVVDGTNVSAIAQTLVELLGDPALLHRMGTRGREWAVQEWSWQIWGERFIDLLFPQA